MSAGDRPAPVRLDDLRAPRFAPEIRALLDDMAALAPGCVLEPDALIEAAVSQEGLEDLGVRDDPGFVERFQVLTAALREEAGLSPWGVVSLHTQLVQFLANRLRLTELERRHPEIADVPVDTPIIIAGLPRTGTTHLHNLLAADPALRSLPYWESLEPVPPMAELDAPTEPDPRRARTEVAVEVADAAMPYFKRMHEMTVDHVHEEIQLLALDLSTMYFETMALLPSWRAYYQSHDQTPHYRFLRRVLQACTFLRGGRRWVLKSPQHLEQLGPISEVFPDATVVLTHRDPVAVMVSMDTMIAYTARMQVAEPDPAAVGAYWNDRIGDMLLAATRDRGLLAPERSIDIRFDQFMVDDMAAVAAVYERAGQPFDGPGRAAMEAYLADHPRGRHGAVVYELGPFGIDPAAQRARLADYVDRFGVVAEW